MICSTEKTQQQLLLGAVVDGSGAGPSPNPKSPPQGGISKSPEAEREYHRRYYQEHREQFRQYGRREYRRNYARYRARRGTEEYKSKLRDYLKEHRAKHPERHKASLKRYWKSHLEYFKSYRQKYAARRRELYQLRKVELCAASAARQRTRPYRDKANARLRKRRIEDPQFALADALRSTMNRAFRRVWVKKPARTEALLGCTIAAAKAHIERQFVDGMSWAHRSSFVIDHIVPVVAFDLRDAEEVRWAFNYLNLQPITPHQNAVKSDTLPSPLPSWLPAHIAERIRLRSIRLELPPPEPF